MTSNWEMSFGTVTARLSLADAHSKWGGINIPTQFYYIYGSCHLQSMQFAMHATTVPSAGQIMVGDYSED